jgi:hypothetical protein
VDARDEAEWSELEAGVEYPDVSMNFTVSGDYLD